MHKLIASWHRLLVDWGASWHRLLARDRLAERTWLCKSGSHGFEGAAVKAHLRTKVTVRQETASYEPLLDQKLIASTQSPDCPLAITICATNCQRSFPPLAKAKPHLRRQF